VLTVSKYFKRAISCLLVFSFCEVHAFTLVKNGQPVAVIILPENADKRSVVPGAIDLVEFIEKMSGAKLPIVKVGEPIPPGMNPIRVGKSQATPIRAALDKVAGTEAGYVIAARGNALYLAGQSPLATSFACTELLERFGVRWYIPGELGERYPGKANLEFNGPDVVDKPDFNPRWLRVDRTWSRRNKLGGTNVPAAHSFAGFISRNEFDEHPDWFPLINGTRRGGGQLCLSNSEVVKRFVKRCKARFKKSPNAIGMSLGPNDGRGWCQCEACEVMDSGRTDPFAGDRDVIDRQIKFMNAVIKEVKKEYPGKKYGFYAYSSYQLPPVTVKPDQAIIPVFAPISYCRLHSMFNPICPDRNAVRKLYEGWADYGIEIHYRGYTFNLAGLQTPFHYFHKWIDDMPWMHEKKIHGFFPESIQSWSASAPQYWLMTRMAWRNKHDPKKVIDEFCNGLFGAAGPHMSRYFWRMADAIKDANFHTGNDTNYPDIYRPDIMKAGIRDIKKAAKSARDGKEKQCVRIFRLAHDYLQAFLNMQNYQTAYEFAKSKEALDRLVKIQDKLINWDPRWLSKRAAKNYLRRFWAPAVVQAYEKTTGGNELVAKFPDEWQFLLDPNEAGEWMELYDPKFIGGNWQTLRTYSQSWSDQGLGYFKGVGWYKTSVDVPKKFSGRRINLWFGAIDEAVKVWVNGRPITYVYERKSKDGTVTKETRDTLSGSWRPLELEITSHLQFGAKNTFVIKAINKDLNEVGTGGLLKVMMLYATKKE